MKQATKKSVRQIRKEEKETTRFDVDKIIPKKYQTAVSLAFIFLLFLIYFSPMYFGGKTFESGDIITAKSMINYVEKHEGFYTLWNPYVFGGLPAHTLSVGYKWYNLIYVGITSLKGAFVSVMSSNYSMWTVNLLLMAFTSFFLIRYKTGNNLVSLFGAIATAFSTGLIVFLFIGHVTKLVSLCMYPLIFLMLLKFQKKIRFLDFIILTIALQLFLQGWHVQIIFYTLLAVGIYFLYYLFRSLVKKEKELRIQLLKSAGVFAVAIVIALAIQSDNLTQIYNYTPYSTRGEKSIVEKQASPQQQSESDFYRYATDWSFSPGEVFTFIIPSYYGFGYSKYDGPLTNNQELRVNTYFGQMPFVDVAVGYMGVLIFIFGLFAIITCWKDPFVQFLTILSAFGLLVSFGRTFSPVFDLMFYYFPYFDKFRVPSMILVLIQMSFPILAAIGLNKIILLKSEKDLRAEKIIKYGAYAFAGIFIISVILSSVLRDMFISRFQESEKGAQLIRGYSQYNIDITKIASDMFVGDTLIVFALAALTFGLALLYLNSKISKDILALVIIVFTVFDLWRIDKRGEEYSTEQNQDGLFNEPGYVSIIKNQKDKSPYRIINLKQDGSPGTVGPRNANYHAHFLIQDISGYSGIKPRSYQDIMDVLNQSPANETLWRMLNVKYIIMDRPVNAPWLSLVDSSNGSVVYNNVNALPRAYFVNSVEKKSSFEVLNAIKNNAFDPKAVSFLEDENLKVDVPDSTANVQIKSYQDEKIVIQAKATGNNFLFLGDTYYPNGWKAYIDEKETKIYRVNHGFRGIIVPEGEHKVEFIYAPKSFYISMYTSLILSSLLVIGLAVGIFLEVRKKKNREAAA